MNHQSERGSVSRGSVSTYILVAVVLAVITYIEFAIVEYEIAWLSSGAILFWLFALSIIKFLLVIMFFMHLREDDRLFSGLFTSGLVIAGGTVTALLLVFSAFNVTTTATAQTMTGGNENVELAGSELAGEEGAHLWEENCITCHQANGRGIPSAVPPHAGHTPLLVQATGGVGGREYMINVMLYGLRGEIEVLGRDFDGVMPSRSSLSNEELATVLNYSVSAWQNAELLPEDFRPFRPSEIQAQRGQGLSDDDVHELRADLDIPTSDRLANVGRPLRVQFDTAAPKDQTLFLDIQTNVTDSRSPRRPGDVLPPYSEAAPSFPAPRDLDYAPEYEVPGTEYGDGDPDSALEERVEARDVDMVAQEAPELEPAPEEAVEEALDTEETVPEETAPEETAPEEAPAEEASEEEAPAEETTAETTETLAQAETEETAPAEEAEEAEAVEVETVSFDYDEELGASTYQSNCLSCHQQNGQGITGAFPTLVEHTPNLYNAEGGRDYLINLQLYGLQGQINVLGNSYNGVMPAWQQLSDEQLAAVLNHISLTWGNAEQLEGFTVYTADEIAPLRDQGLSPADVYELRQALELPY